MVFQFAFVIDFHLLFEILDKIFLLYLGFRFFNEIIWKDLDSGNEIIINFFKATDPKACKCKSKKIIFIDVLFVNFR